MRLQSRQSQCALSAGDHGLYDPPAEDRAAGRAARVYGVRGLHGGAQRGSGLYAARVWTRGGGGGCVYDRRSRGVIDDYPARGLRETAFSDKTAAVIVNSPNNPTGAILSEKTLAALGDFLRQKEALYAKEIYLISDEPYREIVYDGRRAAFPADYYEDTILCYSYSKSLSLPGERIGYILVSPRAKSREDLFAAICGAGRSLGYVCAPSLLQRVVAENQGACANFEIYARNRELLLTNLQSFGYSFIKPEGAFYLFLAAPDGDGTAFSEAAKKYELLLTPSDSFGMKGYVRLSYCISTEAVLRSLPAFRALAADYGILPEQE